MWGGKIFATTSNNFSTCKIGFVFGYVLITIKQYHVAIISVFSNQRVLILLLLLVNYLPNFHWKGLWVRKSFILKMPLYQGLSYQSIDDNGYVGATGQR